MKEALHFLLDAYLKKEGFSFNTNELKLQLLSHPSYPSLHAMTGVLNHFDIDNTALEVPTNLQTLKQLPTYFLSFINSKEFVLVKQLEDSVELLFGANKKMNFAINNFLTIWSGVILVVEKETNESSAIKINNIIATSVLQVLSGLLIIGLFFYCKPSIFESVYFILSLIGISISILILKHELGFQSKTIEKFCTSTKSSSCNKVLNSNGASFLSSVKLSDLSIIYFSALSITSIFVTLLSITYDALIIVTLLVIPITIYSIYYQYKIVRKWCPLCLGIVTVLWLQCCTLFINISTFKGLRFNFRSSFTLFFIFLIITTFWMVIRPLLKKKHRLGKLEIEHYRFKRNFNLFNAVYSKSKYYNTTINTNNEIVLGNKNSLVNILIVTNPSCFYCRAAHNDIERILKNNINNIAITIRFNVPEDKSNIANKIASRILEIYNTESESECIDALHEAYEKDVDLNKWLFKWGESKDCSLKNVIKVSKEWCIKNNINFTPVLFINGKEFPEVYNRNDLEYFIDDLIEQAEIDTNKPENIKMAI